MEQYFQKMKHFYKNNYLMVNDHDKRFILSMTFRWSFVYWLEIRYKLHDKASIEMLEKGHLIVYPRNPRHKWVWSVVPNKAFKILEISECSTRWNMSLSIYKSRVIHKEQIIKSRYYVSFVLFRVSFSQIK